MQIKPHSNSSVNPRETHRPPFPGRRVAAPRYIMPSSRGNQSDICGI
jgi:hypothetical protein